MFKQMPNLNKNVVDWNLRIGKCFDTHGRDKTTTMKATTLLSAVALATACVGSAFGAVTSQNIVGYIKLSLTKGYNLVANQLNNGDNTVVTVFSGLPADGKTTAFKWNGRGYDTSTYYAAGDGGWDDPTLTAAPGDGVFIYVASPATVTLVGEVSLNTTVNLIKGFSLVSSPIPVAGALTDSATVAFDKVADGDVYFQWGPSGFEVNGFTAIDGNPVNEWDAGEPPTLKVGEGFFVKKNTAVAWTRTFSVN
ncbi:MAG TPA: hypothetical protein VMF06_15450 [Candidatus Limnocylindria bacterium]|nr:hypothetical protein [Candidatus Limnocylindria bacterium]